MSAELDSDSWIFVNYAPGSFGSFLTKILESSASVDGAKDQEIFDQFNASHKNITRWIAKLHNGNDIEAWANLTTDQQRRHIIDNLGQLTDRCRVHRLTVPKYNYKFRRHFPNARFIKITVDETEIDLVAKNMAVKTFSGWVINHTTETLKIILNQVPLTKQQEFYFNECKKHIIKVIDNSTEPNTYNISVSLFFNPTSFPSEIERLAEWLNISSVEYDDIYDEFIKRHKEFFKQ